MNIVLDGCVEYMHGASRPSFFFLSARAFPRADPDDPYRLTDQTRKLGLVVCRGLQATGAGVLWRCARVHADARLL